MACVYVRQAFSFVSSHLEFPPNRGLLHSFLISSQSMQEDQNSKVPLPLIFVFLMADHVDFFGFVIILLYFYCFLQLCCLWSMYFVLLCYVISHLERLVPDKAVYTFKINSNKPLGSILKGLFFLVLSPLFGNKGLGVCVCIDRCNIQNLQNI